MKQRAYRRKRYVQRTPEQVAAQRIYDRKYYEEHREQALAAQKRWREKNPEASGYTEYRKAYQEIRSQLLAPQLREYAHERYARFRFHQMYEMTEGEYEELQRRSREQRALTRARTRMFAIDALREPETAIVVDLADV